MNSGNDQQYKSLRSQPPQAFFSKAAKHTPDRTIPARPGRSGRCSGRLFLRILHIAKKCNKHLDAAPLLCYSIYIRSIPFQKGQNHDRSGISNAGNAGLSADASACAGTPSALRCAASGITYAAAATVPEGAANPAAAGISASAGFSDTRCADSPTGAYTESCLSAFSAAADPGNPADPARSKSVV